MAHVAQEIDVLGEVLKLIESTVKVPAADVDIDANLESFGVNSLIGMELMENIEKRFDVTITPAQFTDVDTVRSLAGLLDKLLQAKSGAAPQAAAAQQQPAASEPPRGAGADAVTRSLLDMVNRKYAIALRQGQYGSVESVVDALLNEHADELMGYYGLADGAQPAQGRAAQLRSPLVAVVGMSCRLPDAPNPRVFWSNLNARHNSMREIPKSRWDWEACYAEAHAPGKTISKWGALIDGVDCFDAAFFNIPAQEAETLDPQLRLLLQESYHAVEDAGMDMKSLAGSRTGVFIGYEYSEYEQRLRRLGNQDFTKGPLFSSSSPSYYLSNRISHTFDLCGPSESFNVNCASSAVALNRAYMSLLQDESDVALVGGASLNLFAEDYVTASQYGILSPNGTSGVFDDDANGFTRGEGVATLVLKRLQDAQKSNDRIYCVIRAVHQNYRGAARNISEVKHESITNVLAQCYEKAGVPLESIHYVEVDGYASKWADSFEYEGIKGAFKHSQAGEKHVALGSVKGNIGNVESVSGLANVIKLALSLHHKKFPATISMKRVNSFLDVADAGHPLYIATEEIPFERIRKEEGQPIRAGVNSFADSGVNVHILLEEYLPARPAQPAVPAGAQLFVLSARDGKALESHVQQHIDMLSAEGAQDAFADLAYTSQVGRQALNERLAIVASSGAELLDKLFMVRRAGLRGKLGMESRGIFFNRIDPADKSPLPSLITPDMAEMQLHQCAQTGQWGQAAQLWVNGVAMPWEVLWRGRQVRRASLPTYPFAYERHWYAPLDGAVAAAPVALAAESAEPAESGAAAQPEAAQADAAPQPADPAVPPWYFYLAADAAAAAQASDQAMGGMEKISLFLRQAIARPQNAAPDSVPTDRNFLELGLDSLALAAVIMQTDQLLGINLSPAVLFKHPEIGSLSAYLADTYPQSLDRLVATTTEPAAQALQAAAAQVALAQAERAPQTPKDIVVPLRTGGDKPAVFAVPGAGGSALSMQALSQALGEGQPFYCLEPAGLDGVTPPAASVAEAAQFNLQALRGVQPQGPYRLMGYSNGGIVAFEMARQLLDEGQAVSSLVLLDSLSPPLLLQDPVEHMMVDVFRYFLENLGGRTELSVEALRAVAEDQRSEYLYGLVAAQGLELPKAQFMATFDTATASERACRAYEPPRLDHKLDVTLVRATNGFKGLPADYGWNRFLATAVRVHKVAATHFTLLDDDAVLADVARKLQAPTAARSR